jgi:LPXTG-motif cell wall-anchored protein
VAATFGVVFNPAPGQSVNGSCNLTASGSFTATCQLNNLTGPAVITIPVQGGGSVQLTCSPVVGGATATCSGSFPGTPLVGGEATVTVNGVLVARGIVVAGAVVFPTPVATVVTAVVPPSFAPPLLPPVPPPLPPPLPQAVPLLAPPPVAPGLARGAPPAPEVPVIPEAGSLALVGLGLAGLAGLLAVRRRRDR